MAEQIQLMMTSTLKQIIDNEKLNGDQIYRIGEKIYNFREAYNELKERGATDEQIVFNLYRPFDEYLQNKLKEYANDGMPISCRIGCTHCCHYKVNIYAPEANILLDEIEEQKMDIDWEYVEKQAALKENLEHATSEYSACVFLKEGKCSVYHIRPLSCRKYYVFTDPELCDAKKYQHGQVGVIADIESEIIVSGLGNVHGGDKDGSMAEMLLRAKEARENNVK